MAIKGMFSASTLSTASNMPFITCQVKECIGARAGEA